MHSYKQSCGWLNGHRAVAKGKCKGNWSTGRRTLYSVGGRWRNQFGGMILIVDNRIPDRRQYPSGILFTPNSDMYWPGIEPDPSSDWPLQPHHVSSSRRIATSTQTCHFPLGRSLHVSDPKSSHTVDWQWNPSFSGSRTQSDARPDAIQGTSQAM